MERLLGMPKSNVPATTTDPNLAVLASLGIDVGDREIVSSKDVIESLSFTQVDKDTLLGRPFVITEYKFTLSNDYMRDGKPSLFVTVWAVTHDGEKVMFTDGSTGICKQLREAASVYSFAETDEDFANEDFSKAALITVPEGLRKSVYNKEGVGQATTFYLS